MMRNQLLDALSALSSPQLEILVYKLGIPSAYLPGPVAAPGTRIVEILRWAEQQGRLADVARLLAEVTGTPPPVSMVEEARAPSLPAPSPAVSLGPEFVWPTRFTGPELEELVRALLSAFPSRIALARMVRLKLDRNLAEIATGNLIDTVFELVTTAEAQGFIPELFAAALSEVPRNGELLAIAERRRRDR